MEESDPNRGIDDDQGSFNSNAVSYRRAVGVAAALKGVSDGMPGASSARKL
jgi:hypothetical protein